MFFQKSPAPRPWFPPYIVTGRVRALTYWYRDGSVSVRRHSTPLPRFPPYIVTGRVRERTYRYRVRSVIVCDTDAKKPRLLARLFVLCWHYLSSRQVTLQVLSAQTSLTSVFGMGTGGPSSQSKPTCLPYTLKTEHCVPLQSFESSLSLRFGQAFGLLVSVSSMHYCTSTSDLSTT